MGGQSLNWLFRIDLQKSASIRINASLLWTFIWRLCCGNSRNSLENCTRKFSDNHPRCVTMLVFVAIAFIFLILNCFFGNQMDALVRWKTLQYVHQVVHRFCDNTGATDLHVIPKVTWDIHPRFWTPTSLCICDCFGGFFQDCFVKSNHRELKHVYPSISHTTSHHDTVLLWFL